jgi:hypothetical protein
MLIVLNESTKHKGGTKAVKMNACNASDGIPPRFYRVVPTDEADFILVQQKRQLRRTRRSNGFGRGVFTPPILLLSAATKDVFTYTKCFIVHMARARASATLMDERYLTRCILPAQLTITLINAESVRNSWKSS